MGNQVTIGLCTILDSEDFFRTLVVARQAYSSIKVLESSVCFATFGNPIAAPLDNLNLLEKSALRRLKCIDRGPSELSNNPALSVHILQWCVSEGLISIVPMDEEDQVKSKVASVVRKLAVIDKAYYPHYSFGDYVISHDWAGCGIEEYTFSAGIQSTYTSTSLKYLDFTGMEARNIEIQDVFPILSPTSYLDYYRVIENPKYGTELVQRFREIENEAQYQKDLKLFLPEKAANTVSGGAYSLVKMLIRILHHWRKDTENTQQSNSADAKSRAAD